MKLDRERLYRVEEIFSLAKRDRMGFSQEDRQQMYEARIASLMGEIVRGSLGGRRELRIGLINGRYESTPDVTLFLINEEGKKEYKNDLEIAQFNEFSSSEGIVSFLFRTKLARTCAYPDTTIFLCHVDIEIKEPENLAEKIYKVMSVTSPINDIYLLFTGNGKEKLVQVWPDLTIYPG